MNYYTYKHIRPDTNEVFYIGKGKNNRCNSLQGRNKHWKAIVNKNNGKFIVEIINTNMTGEEANVDEISLIKFYGRKDLGEGLLINLTDGGGQHGYKHTEKTKKKIAKSKTGKASPMKGKPGRKWTKEQKEKSSLKLKGKRRSKEHKEILRKRMIGNKIGVGTISFRRKKVIDPSTGMVYNSILEASKSINIDKAYLSNMLRGAVKNKSGLMYYKDYEEKKETT